MTAPIKFRLRNLGKKIAALAFIVLILVGNLWLIYRFTGDSFPGWSLLVFGGAVVIAFLGGILMIPETIWPSEIQEEIAATSDIDKPES